MKSNKKKSNQTDKKLSLNKQTISNLINDEMLKVKGGKSPTADVFRWKNA